METPGRRASNVEVIVAQATSEGRQSHHDSVLSQVLAVWRGCTAHAAGACGSALGRSSLYLILDRILCIRVIRTMENFFDAKREI